MAIRHTIAEEQFVPSVVLFTVQVNLALRASTLVSVHNIITKL